MKMKRILIFKTAPDGVLESLLNTLLEHKSHEIYCLIQPIAYNRFKEKYPSVHFVNIERNVFDDPVISSCGDIDKQNYDDIYFISGDMSFSKYDNVLEVAEKLKCKRWIFFNKRGQIYAVKRQSKIYEGLRFALCYSLLWFFRLTYRIKYVGKDY